jgi:hypothetical protein
MNNVLDDLTYEGTLIYNVSGRRAGGCCGGGLRVANAKCIV